MRHSSLKKQCGDTAKLEPVAKDSIERVSSDEKDLNQSKKTATKSPTTTKLAANSSLVTVHNINNRKIHTCIRCGLEFTSANSVFRHQEKSCLRVRVICLKTSVAQQAKEITSSKKKCPICSCIFFSTHRVSIHIYKHHRNLLGSALTPPSAEAKRLHEIQLKKLHDTNEQQLEGNEEDEIDALVNPDEDEDDQVEYLDEDQTGPTKAKSNDLNYSLVDECYSLPTQGLAHDSMDHSIESPIDTVMNEESKLNSTF